MQVGMMEKILAPSVEHREKPDLCTQVLGVGRDGAQRLADRPEQNVVDAVLVLKCNDRNRLRDGEDHMEVLSVGEHVRFGPFLHADDTTVPVLAPGLGRTKTGRLWVVLRDERPWSGSAPPAAFYCYSPDRRAERAEALLGKCRGYLHADAYAGFNGLYDRDPKTNQPRLIEVACWSHARRKLYDVHVATGAPLAKEALDRIAELFAIEDEINGRSPDERLTVRQAEAIPRIADLKTFFEAAINQISGKSTLARAIRYALSRWTALARYTTDGRLEISNNAAERAIRPLALGRKNTRSSRPPYAARGIRRFGRNRFAVVPRGRSHGLSCDPFCLRSGRSSIARS